MPDMAAITVIGLEEKQLLEKHGPVDRPVSNSRYKTVRERLALRFCMGPTSTNRNNPKNSRRVGGKQTSRSSTARCIRSLHPDHLDAVRSLWPAQIRAKSAKWGRHSYSGRDRCPQHPQLFSFPPLVGLRDARWKQTARSLRPIVDPRASHRAAINVFNMERKAVCYTPSGSKEWRKREKISPIQNVSTLRATDSSKIKIEKTRCPNREVFLEAEVFVRRPCTPNSVRVTP